MKQHVHRAPRGRGRLAFLALLIGLGLGGPALAADQGPRHHAEGAYDVSAFTYRVVEGDDLAAIAERFGVSVVELKARNRLVSDTIEVGQSLLVVVVTGAGAVQVTGTPGAPGYTAPIDGRTLPAAPAPFTGDIRSVPPSITTPDSVATRIGTLAFKDGMPDAATAAKAYDQIDFTHAYDAFVNTMQGVNFEAIRRGFQAAGVKDNEILVFSKLMDAKSLFLTANADTVYFIGTLDLSQGPMVLETPPKALGTLDDAWWRWVIDFGVPGPDRGEGGKYLIVPPGYDGPLPEGGFYVAHAKTNQVLILGRMFLDHNDPQPAVELIRKHTKIYPYDAGGQGTSIARFLDGKGKLSRIEPPKPTLFHEGSGKVMNTVPPNDASFFELLNDLVQREPATALDPELMGPLAAIGIVKGKPFAPDARMKKILGEAAAVGNAASRTLLMAPRDPSWFYYPDSAWTNFLFQSGYEFETPIPQITREGAKPYPATGYRQLDARSAFFYGITGITPAMAMRLPGVGSQYLLAMQDANKQYFDGATTYRLVLPKGIPYENFWSLTLYDNQTRSMIATPQNYPRAGSQNYPSPAAEANADGSTTVYIGPQQPAGVKRGNWIQTVPGKGWFAILRLYGPKEPFFMKEWRPGEFEPVK